MTESTNDIFRRNHCKTPEWIADLEMPCFDLEMQEFLEEHAFFKLFAAHCFHEIFRVAIFSIQILFKGSLHSCNKSLINEACSGPYSENIGPRSFLYGTRCARSVLSRARADILPVRPSRLVNKIYLTLIHWIAIYPLDNCILASNNRGQIFALLSVCHICAPGRAQI